MSAKLHVWLGSLILLLSPACAACRTVLRVVGDNNYPPYLFSGDDGKPRGYEVDIWKLWQKKTGIRVDLISTDWADAQKMLLSGQADVIDMIFRTPGREAGYDFSAPFAKVPVGVYADAGLTGISGPKSLAGFDVGVERGDACVEHLREQGVASLHEYTSYAEIIAAVRQHQTRIFCMDEYPANYYLYRLRGNTRFVKAFDFYTSEFRRGVRKGDVQTLALVQRGMAMITPQERQALRRKWMGQPVDFTPYARILGYALLVALLLGLVLVIWVLCLRKAVARRTRDLDFMTRHDALTGLPNRRVAVQHLDHLIQQQASAPRAVLLVDLDDFKWINESFGHVVGDQAIHAVAERLRQGLPDLDMIARPGGDEFVLILARHVTPMTVSATASRVLLNMAKPFVLNAQQVFLSAGVGVSLYPADGSDGVTLLKNADAAMYRAKRAGRSECRFYSSALNGQAEQLLRLGASLRRALKQDEFELHYQPQIDLCSGRVVGVEALLRWPCAVEPIAPGQFIPYAEETGLIEPIGLWVLERACHQLADWLATGLPALRMAVNLSPRQLGSRLTLDLRRVLAATGIPAGLLELEITEGALMDHAGVAFELLQAIRQLGVGLAIDDFGTGYSSLAYLRQLPAQVLKIDQSFLRDLPDDAGARAIVSAIVLMGRSLGMRVLAEGVEDERQAGYLRGIGCDQAQGWLYGRAMPADEMREWLKRQYKAAI